MNQQRYDMIKTAAYKDELEKIALSVDDVEDRLGITLSGDRLSKAQTGVDEAKKKSFSLRHPFLTGLPTLGIAPAFAHEKAMNRITRGMMRSDPDLNRAVLAERARQRAEEQLEVENQIALDKANAAKNTASALGSSALAALTMHYANKNGFKPSPYGTDEYEQE